jgi:hypothetical protein
MLKRRVTLALAFFVLAPVAACSSMQSTVANSDGARLHDLGPYVIQVRTPSATLSSVVYEFAVQQFSKSLDIAEHEPGRGVIEVTFSSEGSSAFVGSSTTTATSLSYGSG